MAALLLVRAVASPTLEVCDQVGGTIKPFDGERLNKRLSHAQPGAFNYSRSARDIKKPARVRRVDKRGGGGQAGGRGRRKEGRAGDAMSEEMRAFQLLIGHYSTPLNRPTGSDCWDFCTMTASGSFKINLLFEKLWLHMWNSLWTRLMLLKTTLHVPALKYKHLPNAMCSWSDTSRGE